MICPRPALLDPASLLLSVLLLLPCRVAAATHEVPVPFPTIQDAIDACSPGDTVLVQPGLYAENVVFSDGIVVRSAGGAAATTIDGGSAPPPGLAVVRMIEVSEVALEGFTLTGGRGCAAGGGGVHAAESSGRIADCIIYNNQAVSGGDCAGTGHGGGIFAGDCDLVISGNSIVSNYSDGNGPGIALDGLTGAVLQHNEIIGNIAAQPGVRGGGIYVSSDVLSVSIEFNVIAGNAAEETAGSGAGVHCGALSAVIDHNTIVDNGWAVIGAAGSAEGGPHLGAGIFLTNGFAAVSNNIIGTISPGYPLPGSGVHCSESAGPPVFSHNDVWMNPLFTADPAYGGTCGDPTGEFGNISVDPGFCARFPHDYALYNTSPCVGAGEGGTDIGARGVGCEEPTAAVPARWGSIKRLFEP